MIMHKLHYEDDLGILAGTILAYFPYFEKIKVGMWDHFALYLCSFVRMSSCLSPCNNF
jgi:hypothetical protein